MSDEASGEHESTEEALRFSRAEAAGILAISADAIVSIDEAQRITRFNIGAEKVFGYTADEVVGQPLDLLIPGRFRDRHRHEVDEFAEGPVIARRMGERESVTGLRKNGEEFPVDAAISKLEVGGRKILTAVLRDISEQSRQARNQRFLLEASQVLASSLDFEKTLSEVAHLAVRWIADCCLVDILDEQGRARRLRVAVADPGKHELEERLHRYPRGQMPPPFARAALDSGAPVLRAEVTDEEITSLAEDAEHLRLLHILAPRSFMSLPMEARGHLLGAIVFISSGRRYGEDDLELARNLTVRSALAIDNARLHTQARRAIAARDEVLGIVAHDLRNPLNAIVLSTRVLEQRLRKAGAPEGQGREIDTILRSAARSNRLIEDLLDISRIDVGALSVEIVEVPAAELLGDALESMRPQTTGYTVEVLAPETLPAVLADRGRILQVFTNLIGNALKFTPPGGRLTLGASTDERAVTFRVGDTGKGIAPEHLGHLFDRHWQADRTDRRGTGLGLAIAKGIVEAHKGRIWVDSTPGKGSTFFFTVPIAPGGKSA